MTLPPPLPTPMPPGSHSTPQAMPPLPPSQVIPPQVSRNLPPPIPSIPRKPVKKIDHLSVWQLVLAVVALVCSLVVIALVLLALSGYSATGPSMIQMNFVLWIFILFAATCIPSLLLSIKHLKGVEPKVFTLSNNSLFIAGGILLLEGGLIYLVYRLKIQSIPVALTGLLDVLVIAFPVVAWVIIGAHGLKAHSAQRLWGIFNLSEFVSTSTAMIIEIFMALLVIVAAIGWLAQQTEFAPYLTLFKNQGNLTNMQIQSLVYDIQPLISTPIIYTIVMLGMCLFVPMVEELFKPLGVWFLMGKNITPSEGFFAGLLGGAGFALVESLLVMGSASDAWVSTVIGRTGTGLLHVTTAGILGWAMAKTWQDGKYQRISLTYLGMIFLHGAWNFFAVLLALQSAVVPIDFSWVQALLPYVQWVLCGLAVGMIVLLTLLNRRLQKDSKPPRFLIALNPQQTSGSSEIPFE